MFKDHYKNSEFTYPNLYKNKEKKDSLMFWKRNFKTFWAFGIGKLIRVKQGADFDVLEFDFGRGFGETFTIKVICEQPNVRKQIYTLKHNQYCQVYGFTTDERKTLYALCFFPSYVPIAYDIKHNLKDESEQLDQLQTNDEDYKDGIDFLSQFERK